MAAAPASMPAKPVHPLHAVLLVCSLPLFLGGLISDIAYARTYQIQWLNFAAWLIAGAMVFAGFALAWSLVEAVRAAFRDRRRLIEAALLALLFILGLLNSFMHARDAWATMPGGLVLSVATTVLVFVLTWLSVLAPRRETAA